MIITRSPLRISLGGGGTDLPSYYREHEGFLIAAAIDKHVYITLHRPFGDSVIVKYSKLENVAKAEDVAHPIVREALQFTNTSNRIEIASMSDIPAGTGLGSSGSFTTALLRGLHHLLRGDVIGVARLILRPMRRRPPRSLVTRLREGHRFKREEENRHQCDTRSGQQPAHDGLQMF